MEARTGDERLIVRYLLGELSEEEQSRIEDRVFRDDEFYERLEMVKGELIDDYVQGRLAKPARTRFERHFLAAPHRRHEVELARALAATVAEASEGPMVHHQEPASWWPSLRARFGAWPPAFRLAMAAAALVIVFGGAWLAVQTARLRTELDRWQTAQQTWQQREHELQRQIDQQRARGDELSKQLEQARAQRRPVEEGLIEDQRSPVRFVSFVLSPSVRYRSGPLRSKQLALPPGVPSVKFQIEFEAEVEYTGYQIVLRRQSEARNLWRENVSTAQSTAWGRRLVRRIPARLFATGDYRLTLQGLTTAGAWEEIEHYDFTVMVRAVARASRP